MRERERDLVKGRSGCEFIGEKNRVVTESGLSGKERCGVVGFRSKT